MEVSHTIKNNKVLYPLPKGEGFYDHKIISYWKIKKFDDLEYSNGQEYPYCEETRNEIIRNVISKGYVVMVFESNKFLWIYISNTPSFVKKEREQSVKHLHSNHSPNCSCHEHRRI